jgi:hypothetical protein
MKVGVLSDTHGRLDAAKAAVAALRDRGADRFVHCGDAGEAVLEWLGTEALVLGWDVVWAWGNCDRGAAWRPYPAGIRGGPAPSWSWGGKRLAALHGADWRALDGAVASGLYDFVFTGHTHCPEDRTEGTTRVLNPGSAAMPRDGKGPRCLLLELESGAVEWVFPGGGR